MDSFFTLDYLCFIWCSAIEYTSDVNARFALPRIEVVCLNDRVFDGSRCVN